jgi:hypothetical protein
VLAGAGAELPCRGAGLAGLGAGPAGLGAGLADLGGALAGDPGAAPGRGTLIAQAAAAGAWRLALGTPFLASHAVADAGLSGLLKYQP